jgi:hypothetical protein
LALIVASVTGLPAAASANSSAVAVPTSVSNRLSSATCGSGAAVELSTWNSTSCSGVRNAASEYAERTEGSEPYALFRMICSLSLVMNSTNSSAPVWLRLCL